MHGLMHVFKLSTVCCFVLMLFCRESVCGCVCVCACVHVTFMLLTSQVRGSRLWVFVVNIMHNNADTDATSRHLASKQHEDAVHEVHVPICCLT